MPDVRMLEEATQNQYLSLELENKFKHLWCLIGNTPMLELQYVYKGKHDRIFVKCEHYNLTGSIKDRMALYILYKAYVNHQINLDDTIVEATSGNTGIAFAAIGKALGHSVKIIMPNWLSKERIDIIKSLGADIQLISKEEGGFLGSIKLSEELATKGGVFLPRQFENQFNVEAHEMTTGKEIGLQLAAKGLIADAFVAGVGTGGTVMGVGKQLKNFNPNVKIHPLEPQESPTLTTGYKVGAHRIQGISDEFVPAIVKLDELDEVICASDGDSIIVSQKLSQQLGLAVGISSGANVIGAIKLKQQLGDNAIVVTVLSDDNKKYLSTDLVKDQPAKEEYISTDLKFTGYEPIARLEKSVFATNNI